jgi:hypothetical protein
MTEIADLLASLEKVNNVLDEWDEDPCLDELPPASNMCLGDKIYDIRRWIEATSRSHEIYIYLVMDYHALIKQMREKMIQNVEDVLDEDSEDKYPLWSNLASLRIIIGGYVSRTATMLSNIKQQISSLSGDLWEKYKSETDQTRKEKINKYLEELVSGKIM